jgi:hypothetical protein
MIKLPDNLSLTILLATISKTRISSSATPDPYDGWKWYLGAKS